MAHATNVTCTLRSKDEFTTYTYDPEDWDLPISPGDSLQISPFQSHSAGVLRSEMSYASRRVLIQSESDTCPTPVPEALLAI